MSARAHPSFRRLAAVYAALMLLLAATAALTWAPLGSWHEPVSMAIAALKAALVGLFFMELAYEGPVLWLWVGAGLYWLAILLTLALADYATRR